MYVSFAFTACCAVSTAETVNCCRFKVKMGLLLSSQLVGTVG